MGTARVRLAAADAQFSRARSVRPAPLTPDPSALPATPVENYAVDPTSLLAGLRAGPSLLASLIAHEVLGPPLALRPSGESPRGVW